MRMICLKTLHSEEWVNADHIVSVVPGQIWDEKPGPKAHYINGSAVITTAVNNNGFPYVIHTLHTPAEVVEEMTKPLK